MPGEGTSREPPAGLSDKALWRKSRTVEMAEDDAERTLDLAGFADGRLDPDDRERVAEWLAGDPVAAGDVAAARDLADRAGRAQALPPSIVARAAALVPPSAPQAAMLIPFPPRHRVRPRLHDMARWGSLVAAMAVASWLGFTLGMDTSLSFAQIGRAGEDGFLRELLNPSTGFMGDLTEGAQT